MDIEISEREQEGLATLFEKYHPTRLAFSKIPEHSIDFENDELKKLAVYAGKGPQGCVAIKALQPEQFVTERMRKEITDQNSVVPVFYFEYVDGRHFSCQELFHFTLFDFLAAMCKRKVQPPPRLIARIGLEVANALALFHNHGIAHRDVKPTNIFVKRTGKTTRKESNDLLWSDEAQPWFENEKNWKKRVQVKLGDFDTIARIENSKSDTTFFDSVVGTHGYLAPEQVPGNSYDLEKADIYQLGIVLSELHGTTTVEHQHPIPREEGAAQGWMRSRRGRTDLTAIINKCVGSPESRYTAEELVDDLDAFLKYDPVAKRRNVIIGIAATLVFLIFAAAAMVTNAKKDRFVGKMMGFSEYVHDSDDMSPDSINARMQLAEMQAQQAGQVGDTRGQVRFLYELAKLKSLAGEPQVSAQIYEKCLKILSGLPDEIVGRIVITASLGDTQNSLGSVSAIGTLNGAYEEALEQWKTDKSVDCRRSLIYSATKLSHYHHERNSNRSTKEVLVAVLDAVPDADLPSADGYENAQLARFRGLLFQLAKADSDTLATSDDMLCEAIDMAKRALSQDGVIDLEQLETSMSVWRDLLCLDLDNKLRTVLKRICPKDARPTAEDFQTADQLLAKLVDRTNPHRIEEYELQRANMWVRSGKHREGTDFVLQMIWNEALKGTLLFNAATIFSIAGESVMSDNSLSPAEKRRQRRKYFEEAENLLVTSVRANWGKLESEKQELIRKDRELRPFREYLRKRPYGRSLDDILQE